MTYKVERSVNWQSIINYGVPALLILVVIAVLSAKYFSSVEKLMVGAQPCSNVNNSSYIDKIPPSNSIMFTSSESNSKYNDGIIYNSMYYTDNSFENTPKGVKYTKMGFDC